MTPRGYTLVELLVVMAIMAMIGAITYPFFTSYQFQAIKELNKSDLDDRGNRVLNFIAEEIRETGFLLGALPRFADDTQITIGATFDASMIATDGGAGGEDSLSILKARSFFQKLTVTAAAPAGATAVNISRDAVTSGEIDPGDNALRGVVFENQKKMYRVTGYHPVNGLTLAQPLAEPVSPGTEVLGVRAVSFSLVGGNLRYDNFIDPPDTLLSGVDGLQFQYLVGGAEQNNLGAAPENVRGVRVTVLARAPRIDKGFTNTDPYSGIANRNDYGPFSDGFRRELFSRLVEVKNYAY